MSKLWRTWHVGGDPDKEAFLSRELDECLRSLQDSGWIIITVDKVDIRNAWSMNQQRYVPTVEYIIIGYCEKEES